MLCRFLKRVSRTATSENTISIFFPTPDWAFRFIFISDWLFRFFFVFISGRSFRGEALVRFGRNHHDDLSSRYVLVVLICSLHHHCYLSTPYQIIEFIISFFFLKGDDFLFLEICFKVFHHHRRNFLLHLFILLR